MKQFFISRILFIVMLLQFHFLKRNVSKSIFCLGSSDIKNNLKNNIRKSSIYRELKVLCANDTECFVTFINQIKNTIKKYNLTLNRKNKKTLNDIHIVINSPIHKIINNNKIKGGHISEQLGGISIKINKSSTAESDTLEKNNTMTAEQVITNCAQSKDENPTKVQSDPAHVISETTEPSAIVSKQTENANWDVHEKKQNMGDNIEDMKGFTKGTNSAEKKMTFEKRVETLRALMEERNIDAYIFFNTDEHNSEMINTQDKKIFYLTGFSGTSGILIIPKKEKPTLFIVALYDLQAHNEVDSDLFDIVILSAQAGDPWLKMISKLKPTVIAIDGKTTPVNAFNKLLKYLKSSPDLSKPVITKNVYNNDFSNVEVEKDKTNLFVLEKTLINIIGKVNDREVFIHEVKYNGLPIEDKLLKIKTFFKENDKVENMLVSELDEVAYILNLRGYDYPFSPVFSAYLLFQYDREKQDFKKIVLFTKKKNINDTVQEYLQQNAIVVEEHHDVVKYLKENVVDVTAKGHTVSKEAEIKNVVKETSTEGEKEKNKQLTNRILLSEGINVLVYLLFKEEQIVLQSTPIKQMKAMKNETEIANMIEAHIVDAIALLRFFSWAEEKRRTKQLYSETEISLSKKIDFFRSQNKDFISLSFPTISAIGKNSAIIHYEPTEESDTPITPSMYLLDSGGQYLSGTTDVTRTIHFGKPTSLEKRAYTLVLKGHLHLKRIVFPSYVDSRALDFLARSYLTQYHFNYNHGTGHGVGLALNVHESGCSIAPSVGAPLKVNMVLSNEPGIYLENQFGVRLENMQYVVSEAEKGFPEFLSFADLTLYPYDMKLFDFTMLTKEEINEVNEYHAYVKKILMPIVKLKEREYGPEVAHYLETITKPIPITQPNASFEPVDDVAFDSTTDELAEAVFEDAFVEKIPDDEDHVSPEDDSYMYNINEAETENTEKRFVDNDFNNF